MQKFMTQDRWAALTCMVIAAAVVAALPYQTSSRPIPGARGFDLLDGAFFPKIAVALFLIASIWLFIEGRRRADVALDEAEVETSISLRDFIWAVSLSGGLLVYVQLLGPFGYLPVTVAGVALLSWICGQRSPLGIFVVSVVYPAAVYYLFSRVFMVPLPRGDLWFG